MSIRDAKIAKVLNDLSKCKHDLYVLIQEHATKVHLLFQKSDIGTFSKLNSYILIYMHIILQISAHLDQIDTYQQ